MIWRYEYTPYIWPILISAGFLAAIAIYGWRRRGVPGAAPLAALMLCATLWSLGSALQLAAVNSGTKIFWIEFQAVWQLPMVTAGLWFALEYADVRPLLNRRTAILLAVPPLVLLLLILTNPAHHQIWSGFTITGSVHPLPTEANWVFKVYGFLLAAVSSAVFIWLWWRSPLHRLPVALCLSGQVVGRVAYLFRGTSANPVAPMDPVVLAFTFTAVMYALALFRFGMFDVIPIALRTMFEQMREGMLVFDSERRIIDLNPAAAAMLGINAAFARGRDARQILPALDTHLPALRASDFEIHLDTDEAGRDFALRASPLKHRRGFPLGHLALFHEITEEKRAQAQSLEQQRALAMLHERVRIARELHDGLGQVLGYVKMQGQAARDALARGHEKEADSLMERLVSVADETHTDVREYILGANTTAEGFLGSLRRYLCQFSENYRLQTELSVPPEVTDTTFGPAVEAQLLRIIQEALTNARKHARAHCVRVSFRLEDSMAEVAVEDDGAGFHVTKAGAASHFGLRFMQERAAEVSGMVEVYSKPGQGTRILLKVPINKQ